MAEEKEPKWQEEIEQILRKRVPRPELSMQIAVARELVNLAKEVEVPSGDTGEVVAIILKEAGKDLRPLAAVYAGFQLGVAWEKYQNANRA
ncbi:hypothetical protein ES703_36581 [subsurface metagenome]